MSLVDGEDEGRVGDRGPRLLEDDDRKHDAEARLTGSRSEPGLESVAHARPDRRPSAQPDHGFAEGRAHSVGDRREREQLRAIGGQRQGGPRARTRAIQARAAEWMARMVGPTTAWSAALRPPLPPGTGCKDEGPEQDDPEDPSAHWEHLSYLPERLSGSQREPSGQDMPPRQEDLAYARSRRLAVASRPRG